jgi:hypothetical protein
MPDGGAADTASKILAAIDTVSGWTFFGLLIAGSIILWAPIEVGGVTLSEFRHSWGGWIIAGTVLSAAMVASRILRTAHRGASDWLQHRRDATWAIQHQASRRRASLDELRTLTYEEWQVLADYLRLNATTMTAWRWSEPHRRLIRRGLLEERADVGTSDLVLVMPDFVRQELQPRRAEILASFPSP